MSNDWAELLMTDHQTTEKVFEAVSNAFGSKDGPSTRMIGALVDYLEGYVEACHNKKEEDHLFPLIESRGIPRHGGPLAVMLAEHAQSKELIARLAPLCRQYAGGDRSALAELKALFEEYSALLKNHYWKENDILYPMARRVMTADDAAQVVAGIEATEAALGPDTRAKYYELAKTIEFLGGIEDLSAGLPKNMLAAMLNTLPMELSFVDENDIVRYFSHENHPKIFPRTRGVIGMAVQNCHPQKSVHMVNRILEDFKAGKRELAEFWIDFGDKKIHIRYWPVRDPDGRYLGCLETVQDVTSIRALEGQRRLLDDA